MLRKLAKYFNSNTEKIEEFYQKSASYKKINRHETPQKKINLASDTLHKFSNHTHIYSPENYIFFYQLVCNSYSLPSSINSDKMVQAEPLKVTIAITGTHGLPIFITSKLNRI